MGESVKWIILAAFIIMITIMVVVVVKTLKKMNGGDASNKGIMTKTSNMSTAQDFLPFATIESDTIDLGGFKYRMLVECSSINYNLKTEAEKNIIENSFKKFLTSLSFPISIFIQTKEINYGNIINSLREDINDAVEDYPQLSKYAEYYFNEIVNLKKSIKNTKQKKKYIIIPYEETISMNELNSAEKKDYSIKEIRNRAEQIVSSVNSLGLSAKILDTKEIIELMYSMYHRDDDSFVETIGSGEYLVDIVGNGKPPEMKDELRDAIEILQEAENRFRVRILEHKLPIEASQLFSAITEDLMKMKQGLLDIESDKGLEGMRTLEDDFNDGVEITFNPFGNGFEEKDADAPVFLDPDKFMCGGK